MDRVLRRWSAEIPVFWPRARSTRCCSRASPITRTTSPSLAGTRPSFTTPQPARETAIQLLEYANSQLLEFRHYDELLTEELDRVYDLLDGGTGIFARWRLARSATQLHTVLLDVAS